MNLVTYTIALRKALHQEGMNATTYSILLCIEAGHAETFRGLARLLGLTEKGVRDCVSRRCSPFFEVEWSSKPARVAISPVGREAVAKVVRHLPLEKPRPRRRQAAKSPIDTATQLTLAL